MLYVQVIAHLPLEVCGRSAAIARRSTPLRFLQWRTRPTAAPRMLDHLAVALHFPDAARLAAAGPF